MRVFWIESFGKIRHVIFGKHILDIGCDNSIVSCFIARVLPEAEVTAIDRLPLRKKRPNAPLGARFEPHKNRKGKQMFLFTWQLLQERRCDILDLVT